MSKKTSLEKYFKDVPAFQKDLKNLPESHWIERGQKMALNLFHEMAVRVPAYKDFLNKNEINHKKVKSIEDFRKIPTINKDNYLRKYSRSELCWDGKFSENSWVISATSGSTGKPFYFPRTDLQDTYYATTAELYLRENFEIQNKSTLYIDAFALGIWIGGLFTYEAIKKVSEKGYKLSIVTPGIIKQEVINCVKNLGKDFDQIIIGCYPPILKDIIDMGVDEGINWKDINLGIIFSAEGFGEDFREYIADKAGLDNIYKSNLNHYGTVDLGTMSHETALTTLYRVNLEENEKLKDHFIKNYNTLPTVTQYIPEMFYFEQQNDNLLCSSRSGIPLVRYDLKDKGMVLTLKEIKSGYKECGLDLDKELADKELTSSIWNLPTVSVYERDDLSISLVGGIIYPEEIKRILIKSFSTILSGKFTLQVVKDKDMNSKLVINAELKQGVIKSEVNIVQIVEKVVEELLINNSEFASNYQAYKEKLNPKVILWEHGDDKYFSGKGKQKWVSN